jgi:hypothetical protein
MRAAAVFLALAVVGGRSAAAQIQIRIGDSSRTIYSEIHESLREGTPVADTVAAIMAEKKAAKLWPRVRDALDGHRPYNDGLLALTRIAELRDPTSADSVRRWGDRIEKGTLKVPAGEDPGDLLPALHAIELELSRAKQGDLALLSGLLPRIPEGNYDLGDAWVFGRLDQGAADTMVARFLATQDQALRIRYLTLLSFSRDTSLIPFLAHLYISPDSFGLSKRIGIRASDGLIWIGTRRAVAALLAARDSARTRGTYADPSLGHADLDFLGNDSSMVVSRTGRWLTEWRDILK